MSVVGAQTVKRETLMYPYHKMSLDSSIEGSIYIALFHTIISRESVPHSAGIFFQTPASGEGQIEYFT